MWDLSAFAKKLKLRSLAVGIFILIGCLSLTAYVAVHWAERQILTTDNWVTLVGPLPKQPVVSTALGNYIGDQVFSSVDVQQKISQALPPKAGFLAGPLTGQLHNLTNQTAKKIVASDNFQTIWIAANRSAMDRFVSTARSQKPPLKARLEQKFNVNISNASGQLGKALGKVSTAIPALSSASKKTLVISADLHAKGDKVRQTIRVIDYLSVVLPLITATSFLLALAFSTKRRKTTMIIAVSTLILMLLELVAIKILRQQILDQVRNPANLSAIGYIYDVLLGWLKSMIITIIIATVLIWVICMAAGPAKWSRSLRNLLRINSIKNSKAMAVWQKTRLLAKKWQNYTRIAIVLIILIVMAAAVSLSSKAALNGLLLAISLLALLYIIATPPYVQAKKSS